MLHIVGGHQLNQNITAVLAAHADQFHFISSQAECYYTLTVLRITIMIEIADNLLHDLVVILRFHDPVRFAALEIEVNIGGTLTDRYCMRPVNFGVFAVLARNDLGIAQRLHDAVGNALDIADAGIFITHGVRHSTVVRDNNDRRIAVQLFQGKADKFIIGLVHFVDALQIFCPDLAGPLQTAVDIPVVVEIDPVQMGVKEPPVGVALEKIGGRFHLPFQRLGKGFQKNLTTDRFLVAAVFGKAKHRPNLVIQLPPHFLRPEIIQIAHVDGIGNIQLTLTAVLSDGQRTDRVSNFDLPLVFKILIINRRAPGLALYAAHRRLVPFVFVEREGIIAAAVAGCQHDITAQSAVVHDDRRNLSASWQLKVPIFRFF